MDRRQRKSRNAIFSSFNRLFERKSYAAITVTEIIEEADVGRTTFYAHFQTKDDLLGELSKEILDHVFSTSLWNEGSHDFSSEEKSYEHLVSHILYHLREGSMNIRRILSSDCSSIFLRHLQERFSMYLTVPFLAVIYLTLMVFSHMRAGNGHPDIIISRIDPSRAWLVLVCAVLELLLFLILMSVSGKVDSRLSDREAKRNKRIMLQEEQKEAEQEDTEGSAEEIAMSFSLSAMDSATDCTLSRSAVSAAAALAHAPASSPVAGSAAATS